MENAIPMFMEYGAMGILALGFVVLLILFVRADKRASQYAATLKETSFDRSQLISVVRDNTRAITSMVSQIEAMIAAQNRTVGITERLDMRLETGRCPFSALEPR